MDLLLSMNLEDLPEQQTRTVDLMEKYPDFDLNLGFDACCTCGTALATTVIVVCPSCRRVKYCSEQCRQQDANATASAVMEGEMDQAMGHSSVACALLSLCDDDEAVESKTADHLDSKRLEAAQDRVRSEDESYPATLANVIAEGACYQHVLVGRKKLVVHVLGASVDDEFWGDESDEAPALDAYAEALADLADTKGLSEVELVFVGPECPLRELEVHKCMRRIDQDRIAGDLLIRSVQGLYTKDILSATSLTKPDIVVFFNPGFTVPDYNWKGALAAIERGTPFLSTTNTELEGIADCQYLLDQDKIQSLPPGLADIFGVYSSGDDESSTQLHPGSSFFTVNPFAGNRVRQSGTLANDIYVKNRWILGGTIDSFDPSKDQTDASSKKQKTVAGSGNKKLDNPALI